MLTWEQKSHQDLECGTDKCKFSSDDKTVARDR
jgi:hypothetical protein